MFLKELLTTAKNWCTKFRQPLKKEDEINPVSAILALKKGLLVEVFPSLRSAQISWDHETIYLHFYHDREISDDDHESLECIATEVIANFSIHLLDIDFIRKDYPLTIPDKGILVYHRREPLITSLQVKEKWIFLQQIFQQDPSLSLRVKVLLIIIFALLGEVSPPLRAVRFELDEKKRISIFITMEGF